MSFSERSALDRELNPLTLAHRELGARGVGVLDLTSSNPTESGLVHDQDSILRAIANPSVLGYEPTPLGPLSARRALCAEWARSGFEVVPEQVFLSASTSEAYAWLFKLLCDPGDEVLAPVPGYPLCEPLARFESVTVAGYPLAFDGAWYLDPAEVGRRVGPRTRAIVLVSPHNPTGHVLKRDELSALAALGLPLIVDEVFSDYVLKPSPNAVRSGLEARETLVFSLSGLSKAALLPQLKLAWTTVSGPPALVREALERLEWIADAYLSLSAPAVAALPHLLEGRRPMVERARARLRNNQRVAEDRLAGTPLTMLPVEAGWYAVMHLPGTRDEEAWALGLLREARVRIDPGYFFDLGAGPYVVVSLLTPEARFSEGIERIARYVSSA